MKKLFVIPFASLLLMSGAASAQLAPAPNKSPRTPVNQQVLADHKQVLPPSSTVQGQAVILDSEKIRIGDVDMRLFGVVPPQLSASFGPQARAMLDTLVAGQAVSCFIRDRDQAGRFLASCHTPSNTDLALELLRHGLAVTARGSLATTDLAATYLAAEQAAETHKLGLWSVPSAAPATISDFLSKMESTKAEVPKAEPVAVMPQPMPAQPAPALEAKKDDSQKAPLVSTVQNKVDPSALAASTLSPSSDEDMAVPDGGVSFVARYQILITGLVMLITAFSILGVVSAQRRREKRDEMKAVAAALRGELMAARAVCNARLKVVASEADDKVMVWPRIRSTLYQAYIGRLGWLGAELARQVASIYGQSSDYAAYYNKDGDEVRAEGTPKRQALQMLVQHIEEVLPKLSQIEQTGSLTHGVYAPISYADKSGTVRQTVAPAKQEKPKALEVLQGAAAGTAPLWNAMRNFARERFVEEKNQEVEENDYAAMIEEEMANLSFSEAEDEANLHNNITKFRDTGS